MSMYADYLKEKTNDKILETEKGFATYRYLEDAVYIVDIYVHPDFRKEKVASMLADHICEEALRNGRKILMGSVVPSAKNSTDSLKVLLGYGMKLQSASTDFIIFRKEL